MIEANANNFIVFEKSKTTMLQREKSFSSIINPTFNYNTTIVELKPFKKEGDENVVSENINNTVTMHASNEKPKVNNNASIASVSQAVPITSSSSCLTAAKLDDSVQMFDKIIKQKKFLVNKNIRFYEPVKDATMLVQLDLLRSKLQPAEKSELKRSKTTLGRDFSVLNNPRSSLVSNINMVPLIHQSELSPISKKENVSEARMSIVNIVTDSSTSQVSSQRYDPSLDDVSSLKNYRLPVKSSINEENESNMPKNDDINSDPRKDYLNYPKPIPNHQLYQGQDDEDFEKLKKYAKSRRKSEIVPQLSNEKQITDLKKQNTTLIETDKKLSLRPQTSHLKRSLTFISRTETINLDKNLKQSNTSIQAIKSSYNIIPPKTINAQYKKKMVEQIVRKSSKFRLDNIYRPLESMQLETMPSRIPSPTRSPSKLARSPSFDYKEREQHEINLRSKIDNYHDNIDPYIIDEPYYEPKINGENFRYIPKKEYPNERFQRIKNKKMQRVTNIINDIPSTLNTMSRIGQPTNVERLLTSGLTDFYTRITNKRLIH